MGYIGNQTSNSYTSLDKQTITGDGGASYTLDHAVANVNEIEVFVNNVRQEPSVAYTVSGTALTMTGNVEASDDFYVVFQGKAIQTVVPPDDSVTTARINDDAVTNAKIADNAVDTAQIAANAVTSAKLYSGHYADGLTDLDVWYLSANATQSSGSGAFGSLTRFSQNFDKLGTGVTQNSGVFSFPSTGIWEIHLNIAALSSGVSNSYIAGYIYTTIDNGTNWVFAAGSGGGNASSGQYAESNVKLYFKVDDTSNDKVRFHRDSQSGFTMMGNSTGLRTFAVFKKLAEL